MMNYFAFFILDAILDIVKKIKSVELSCQIWNKFMLFYIAFDYNMEIIWRKV